MVTSDLLIGWKQIAQFLGVSERSIRGYKRAELKRRPYLLPAQKIWKKIGLRLVGRFEGMVKKTSLNPEGKKNGFH